MYKPEKWSVLVVELQLGSEDPLPAALSKLSLGKPCPMAYRSHFNTRPPSSDHKGHKRDKEGGREEGRRPCLVSPSPIQAPQGEEV